MTTNPTSDIATVKRGPGRPPIENPLNARIMVRFHRADDHALDEAATREGVTKAEYIRRHVLAAVRDAEVPKL